MLMTFMTSSELTRLKSSVQYEDHPAGIVLNEPVLEIFFRLHQGLELDDHARTFSSLLIVEIDKRNLNPLKEYRMMRQEDGLVELSYGREMMEMMIADSSGDDVDDEDEDDEDGEGEEEEHLTLSTLLFDITC
ncbi:hypothetical protein Tco_0117099 [Tanacetum coccineum]|uniref:Uncharacterized protein n=1 Tax=Tanacetum coccineum TaxID=301880 RepID=A0ABQ5FI08_9ASTR